MSGLLHLSPLTFVRTLKDKLSGTPFKSETQRNYRICPKPQPVMEGAGAWTQLWCRRLHYQLPHVTSILKQEYNLTFVKTDSLQHTRLEKGLRACSSNCQPLLRRRSYHFFFKYFKYFCCWHFFSHNEHELYVSFIKANTEVTITNMMVVWPWG